jgi:signal transduction histidine kinase
VTSVLPLRSGLDRTAERDNEGMLRVANVTLRAAILVLAGIFTFIAPWPGAAYGAVEIAVFAAAAIVMALWVLAERSPATRERFDPLLPYAFGFIAVTCGAAAALPGGGDLIAVSAIVVVSAGTRTGLAAGWIVLGLGVAGIESAGLARGASVSIMVGYPAILLVALLLGHNRRAHRVQAEQSAALLAKADQLRTEQAKVATLDERTRIAREIHDVLAHSLGALGVHLEVIRAALTDQHDVPRAVELLDQAHGMATDGLSETRRAVHALRGETLPLPEGLARLSADHQRRYGAPVSFRMNGEPHPLPPDAGLALTRTAQEALVNTAKHAPHRPVEICLDYAKAGTSLVVTSHLGEDGPGNPEPGLATVNGGYGLTGMRERLLLLNGTLSAGRDGTDWVVVAKVPR